MYLSVSIYLYIYTFICIYVYNGTLPCWVEKVLNSELTQINALSPYLAIVSNPATRGKEPH